MVSACTCYSRETVASCDRLSLASPHLEHEHNKIGSSAKHISIQRLQRRSSEKLTSRTRKARNERSRSGKHLRAAAQQQTLDCTHISGCFLTIFSRNSQLLSHQQVHHMLSCCTSQPQKRSRPHPTATRSKHGPEAPSPA